jgi:hypothetical protein
LDWHVDWHVENWHVGLFRPPSLLVSVEVAEVAEIEAEVVGEIFEVIEFGVGASSAMALLWLWLFEEATWKKLWVG